MNLKNPLSPQLPNDMCLPFTAEKIVQQLKRVMESEEFHATQSQRKLLEYVVHKTVAGESSQIKGYTIATQLFGRKEDFDPNIDPIVSIHANKLRRALERYYFTAGSGDPLLIEIPKGTYVPLFTSRPTAERRRPKAQPVIRTIPTKQSWPTLLIRHFKCLSQKADENSLSVGLATALVVELSVFKDIRMVLQSPDGSGKRAAELDTRFTLDGTLRYVGKEISLSIYLFDTTNGIQLWGESYQLQFDPTAVPDLEKQISRSVAAILAGESGVIAQTIAAESKSKPTTQLSSYEAIVRYYEFERQLTADLFIQAQEALEYAATIDPDCGQVWSMLGRFYGQIYSLELPGFETALVKAVTYAEKGVQKKPDCQKSKIILAYVRMLCNELPSALAELNRAMALDPESLLFLDGIGYLLTLLGDHKRGTAIIHEVMQQNPCYNPIVHHALWLDHIRQEKYDQAYLETFNLHNPSFFWEPLVKASTFGLLGMSEEGDKAVQQLLTLKPDFQARGRILIGHYIKREAVRERVIEGLCKAGLSVD